MATHSAVLNTSIYAALLALMGIFLTYRVILMRGKTGISILDGGSKPLALRIRQFGNFIEIVPLVLILMLLVEIQGVSSYWVHAMGTLILLSRICHPIGLDAEKSMSLLRIFGTVTGQISILIGVYQLLAMQIS